MKENNPKPVGLQLIVTSHELDTCVTIVSWKHQFNNHFSNHNLNIRKEKGKVHVRQRYEKKNTPPFVHNLIIMHNTSKWTEVEKVQRKKEQ